MENGILQTKSESFSSRIVKLKIHLQTVHHEKEMSGQIVRSGTSVGANIAEAFFAQSDADFVSKLFISLKEAGETRHWLKTLHNTGYITDREFESMYKDCQELIRLLIHTINKKRNANACSKRNKRNACSKRDNRNACSKRDNK